MTVAERRGASEHQSRAYAVRQLRDRELIHEILDARRPYSAYALGQLDPRLFRLTEWWQAEGEGAQALVLHSSGGLGRATGGNRTMVEPLARAAMALGADGLFCETHPDPDRSPSDGANMVPLDQFADMLSRLLEIRTTVERISQTAPRV